MHMEGLGSIRYIHISLSHLACCVTMLAGRACTCCAIVLKLEGPEVILSPEVSKVSS